MISTSIFCNGCRLNPYSGFEPCAACKSCLRSSPTRPSSSLALADPSHRSSSPHTPSLHSVSVCNQSAARAAATIAAVQRPKQQLRSSASQPFLICSLPAMDCYASKGCPNALEVATLLPAAATCANPSQMSGSLSRNPGMLMGFFVPSTYYHPSMKEYRLLRNSPFGYEILTIGAKEWRRITCLFDSTPSPILEFCVLYGPPSLDAPPIPMHGKLRYLPTTETSLIWLIMVFDINSEKFGLMSLPECCRTKEWTIHEARLIELEGKLGVSTAVSDAVLDLWMLEDYEKQVWVKRYRIRTTPEREHIAGLKPLVVSDDGEALADWRGDLVLYDFKHHTRSKVIVEDDFRITNVLYKESLIRHGFFETGYQTGFITSPMSYLHTSAANLIQVVSFPNTSNFPRLHI